MEALNDRGEFYLNGYYCEQEINFQLNGKDISLSINKINIEKLEELKSIQSDFLETGLLQILGLKNKGEFLSIAIDIKNLLSIALGRRVSFDRQSYFIDGRIETVQRDMSKNDNQGEQIIPDFEIKNYLEKTLPIWLNYSKSQKDDMFIITDYLNQTKYGFIDDRILRTVQAWECAANYWVKEVELSADLKELREKIKLTYIEWKKDKKDIDKDGELGKRLTNSLDQEKLMSRLEKLIEESGLMVSKLTLDLRKLKNLRDKVAHTGRINVEGAEIAKILQDAIRGLQLILLKKLGYDGLVYGEKNDWQTLDNISDYFK